MALPRGCRIYNLDIRPAKHDIFKLNLKTLSPLYPTPRRKRRMLYGA